MSLEISNNGYYVILYDDLHYCLLGTVFYVYSLYLIYPRCSPDSETDDLKRLQSLLPRIEPGEGRTFEMQALYQMIGLIGSLAIAVITGALTGNAPKYIL